MNKSLIETDSIKTLEPNAVPKLKGKKINNENLSSLAIVKPRNI
jgi:hypothetical protein